MAGKPVPGKKAGGIDRAKFCYRSIIIDALFAIIVEHMPDVEIIELHHPAKRMHHPNSG